MAVAAPAGPSPAPASWSRHVAERLYGPHPLQDESGFVATIERAVGRRNAALVAGSDASLLSLSRARERLARYTLPAFPDVGVVEKVLDKLTLASAAAGVGLDSPPMIACHGVTDTLRAARELGFPVIVKPMRSVIESGGARRQLGAVSIADEAAIEAAVRATGERCLVQRTEAGTVASFAGVFADGRLIGEAFSRYRRTWNPEAGERLILRDFRGASGASRAGGDPGARTRLGGSVRARTNRSPRRRVRSNRLQSAGIWVAGPGHPGGCKPAGGVV